ncbi:MAG: hypothetical protein M0P31_05500 [Solirubrobacteraceae bacterium]|nr:hypothetical protein [Solirubrobacteraceae bacterium]
MSRSRRRRPRATAYASTAALAGALALPAVAPAAVSTTSVTSPTEDAVIDTIADSYFGGIGEQMMTVTGVAPGAADGDELNIACLYSGNGIVAALQLGTAEVEGAAFTAEVRRPTYTCRIRAIPPDVLEEHDYDLSPDTDLSAFAGPRVLGGGFASYRIDESDSPWDGADIFQSIRGQRRGLVMGTGLSMGLLGVDPAAGASGGIYATALIEDTYLRLLFGPSAMITGFGLLLGEDPGEVVPVDVSNAGVVVDGLPASPVPAVGDQRSRLVSRTLDPATGGVTIVETAPVALIEAGEDDRPTLRPSGVSVRRTYRQDEDGRQITFTDEFRSADGRAHRIEVRYGQSLSSIYYGGAESEITKEPASFRLPWATGEEYIVPEGGETFGAAPPGRTTIWVHGPRQDYSALYGGGLRGAPRAAGDGDLPRRAEGAITFADAPTDVRFLNASAFVMRFVRDVPAGGSATLTHTYSQDMDPKGLDDLVDDTPEPPPSAVLPAPPTTTPLPTRPAPVPATPPFCMTPFVSLVDLAPIGGERRPRTRLVGVASPLLAGKTVRVRRDGKQVARSRVREDGTIRVTVAAPKKSARARARARYRIVVEGFRSRALKATRKATITQQKVLRGGRISVRGRIKGARRARTLVVTGQATCGDVRQSSRTVRTDRRGRFRVVLAPPTGAAPAVIYRLRLAGGRTTTLPVVVGRP